MHDLLKKYYDQYVNTGEISAIAKGEIIPG
jgi:hypothetical protein